MGELPTIDSTLIDAMVERVEVTRQILRIHTVYSVGDKRIILPHRARFAAVRGLEYGLAGMVNTEVLSHHTRCGPDEGGYEGGNQYP